jgi:type IV pilus assembly protein PilA
MHSLRQRLNARDESAFTLIELLVVLIIIGVLLAIAIPSYLGFQKKAQQTAAQSDVRQAVPDAEAYYSDYGDYAFTKLANGSSAGSAVAALQSYDAGLSTAIATAATGTVIGGPTEYCISASVSGNWAHVIGPTGATAGGTTNGVVDDKTATADPCTGWTPV